MRNFMPVRKLVVVVVGLLALGSAGSAFAQYYPPPAPPPPPPGYYAPPAPPPPPYYYRPRILRPPPTFFTLTFQPLMLIPWNGPAPQEFFEVGAEFKVARWLGLEAIGGVGVWQDATLSGTNGEGGLEINFYPVGGFRRGIQLAPFVRYFGDAAGSSLEWGGLIGYKWTSWAGFTMTLQFGLGLIETLSFTGSPVDVADGLVPNDVQIPWGTILPAPGGMAPVGFFRWGIGWSL